MSNPSDLGQIAAATSNDAVSAAPAASNEIIIRLIKLLDIGYVAVIYFALGMLLSKMMDYFFGDFNPTNERKKHKYTVILEAMGMLWLHGIVIYFVRNIVSAIPFPLNGVYGFEHLKVKEVTNATVFVYSYLYFQKHFQSKMRYIYSNIINGGKKEPALTPEQLALVKKEISKQRVQLLDLQEDILSKLQD